MQIWDHKISKFQNEIICSIGCSNKQVSLVAILGNATANSIAKMDDCTLEKLAIKPGKLTPKYHLDTLEYSTTLGSNVEKINIDCLTSDTGASYCISVSVLRQSLRTRTDRSQQVVQRNSSKMVYYLGRSHVWKTYKQWQLIRIYSMQCHSFVFQMGNFCRLNPWPVSLMIFELWK